MKANEAPENVYLALNMFGDIIKDQWQFHRLRDDDIEYTRTDAFIEKVSGWLKDCATFTDMNGKKRIDEECYKATFDDFKKYMKGE